MAIEQDGSLCFSFQDGCLTESAPIAWQDIAGQRIELAVSFQRQGDSRVGFALGGYDAEHTLYIDPNYTWHTFYGGTDEDRAYAMAVDSSGNVYVTGYSFVTWNGPPAKLP